MEWSNKNGDGGHGTLSRPSSKEKGRREIVDTERKKESGKEGVKENGKR